MGKVQFQRQEQTMRPAVASKRLENAINQWLAKRRFNKLAWSATTGPATPLGGMETVMTITFDYDEVQDQEEGFSGHRYQVKAFLPPPTGPGSRPGRPPEADLAQWQNYTKADIVDRIDVRLGSTILEIWVLVRRRGP